MEDSEFPISLSLYDIKIQIFSSNYSFLTAFLEAQVKSNYIKTVNNNLQTSEIRACGTA
jgi:hypothetical protein